MNIDISPPPGANSPAQLTGIANGDSTTTGNVTGTGATSYSYNPENRQNSATDAPGIGGGSVSYLFDGAGQRVEKVFSSGASTVYVYL